MTEHMSSGEDSQDSSQRYVLRSRKAAVSPGKALKKKKDSSQKWNYASESEHMSDFIEDGALSFVAFQVMLFSLVHLVAVSASL